MTSFRRAFANEHRREIAQRFLRVHVVNAAVDYFVVHTDMTSEGAICCDAHFFKQRKDCRKPLADFHQNDDVMPLDGGAQLAAIRPDTVKSKHAPCLRRVEIPSPPQRRNS